MVEIAKYKLEKHDRLTCMFLPTLHLYINFSSSCKDLCYSPPPPPLTCNPPKKGWHFCFWHFSWEKRTHLTRPCCHPLSDGWSSEEGDGRALCSSFGFEEVLCFRAQLSRRSRCWQLSGKSEELSCVQKVFWWFCWTHLLKSCIGESVSGNVELCQVLVELLEENFKLLHRILLAVLGGEDEDDVGADLLDQGSRGDVLLDELGQRVDWEPVKAQYGDLIRKKSETQTSYCQWTGWWWSHGWRGRRCPRQQTPPCPNYPQNLLRKEPLVLPA